MKVMLNVKSAEVSNVNEEFVGRTVLKAVKDVIRITEKRYYMSDLESYLLENAVKITKKFDPSRYNGWESLGEFLFCSLKLRVKNFKRDQYKYVEGIVFESSLSGADDEEPSLNNILSEEDKNHSNVIFSDMWESLSSEISDFQRDILHMKLEGLSEKAIADFFGVHNMKISREMKKIQRIALRLGFLN